MQKYDQYTKARKVQEHLKCLLIVYPFAVAEFNFKILPIKPGSDHNLLHSLIGSNKLNFFYAWLLTRDEVPATIGHFNFFPFF